MAPAVPQISGVGNNVSRHVGIKRVARERE